MPKTAHQTALHVVETPLPAPLQFAVDRMLQPEHSFSPELKNLLHDCTRLFVGLQARIRPIDHPPGKAVYLPPDRPQQTPAELWTALESQPGTNNGTAWHGPLTTTTTEGYGASMPLMIDHHALGRLEFVTPSGDGQHALPFVMQTIGNWTIQALRAKALEYEAGHDQLTGLAGRRLLLDEIGQTVKQATPNHPSGVIFHLRLDSLVEVNDNFGYAAGDMVLVALARRLEEVDGFPARISGNQFAVLVRGAEAVDEVPELSERIRRCVSEPFFVNGQDIDMHSDVGCALLADPLAHPAEILFRSEVAMLHASRQLMRRRHNVFTFDDSRLKERRQRHHLHMLVRRAFTRRNFFLLYQPIYDLENDRFAGAEALVRMRDSNGRVLDASEFVPIVANIRHQACLDELVFAEFLRHIASNDAARCLMASNAFTFTLNASPDSFCTPRLAEQWLEQIDSAGLSPGHLIVELVEHPAANENHSLTENLRILREAGVLVCLDDFGLGYSNLNRLSSLPIDMVKFERSLVAEFDRPDGRGHIFLPPLVGICRDLGLITVAEGIETEAQESFARASGCQLAQGYYYGKAGTPDAMLGRVYPPPPQNFNHHHAAAAHG